MSGQSTNSTNSEKDRPNPSPDERRQNLWNYAAWSLLAAEIALTAEQSAATSAIGNREDIQTVSSAAAALDGAAAAASGVPAVQSDAGGPEPAEAPNLVPGALTSVAYSAPRLDGISAQPFATSHDQLEFARATSSASHTQGIVLEHTSSGDDELGNAPSHPGDNDVNLPSGPNLPLVPHVGGIIDDVGHSVGGIVTGVGNVVTDLLDQLLEPANDVLGMVQSLDSILDTVLDGTSETIGNLIEPLSSTTAAVFEVVADLTGPTIISLANSVDDVVNALPDTLDGVVESSGKTIDLPTSTTTSLLGGGSDQDDTLPTLTGEVTGPLGLRLGNETSFESSGGAEAVLASSGSMSFTGVQTLPTEIADDLFNGTRHTDYGIELHATAEAEASLTSNLVGANTSPERAVLDHVSDLDHAVTGPAAVQLHEQLPSTIEDIGLRGIGDGIL